MVWPLCIVLVDYSNRKKERRRRRWIVKRSHHDWPLPCFSFIYLSLYFSVSRDVKKKGGERTIRMKFPSHRKSLSGWVWVSHFNLLGSLGYYVLFGYIPPPGNVCQPILIEESLSDCEHRINKNILRSPFRQNFMTYRILMLSWNVSSYICIGPPNTSSLLRSPLRRDILLLWRRSGGLGLFWDLCGEGEGLLMGSL